MSLGYAGRAWLEIEDENTVIYSYAGENWNVRDEDERNRLEGIEGSFTIRKSCLLEPIVQSKLKRMPSGRKKLVEKKTLVSPDITELIAAGDITIDKLCGTDSAQEGYQPRAYQHLLRHIFEQYQLDGALPERVGFVV